MATGTVKWFNGEKGFGFITQDAVGPMSSCTSVRFPARAIAISKRAKRSTSRRAKALKGLQAVNVRVRS